MSVYRLYVTKRAPHDVAAKQLLKALKNELSIKSLTDLKILNRYDIESSGRKILEPTFNTVFAEPMVDDLFIEDYPFDKSSFYFAVEYLPGQYDQRSDSAEQCVKVMTGSDDVKVASAKVYIFNGDINKSDIENIKKYIINKIDQREASLDKKETLVIKQPEIKPIESVKGFIDMDDKTLAEFLKSWGLAMSLDDLKFSQNYFKNIEKRNPTETEIKLLDTYWSDHCRHTTFNTTLTDIKIEDGDYKEIFQKALNDYFEARKTVYGKDAESRRLSLMDMATIGAKHAKKIGLLDNLEISDENNACSIEIDVKTGDKTERWLLQFKNETHNHPTEIEPFGGAATCLGGAIRDPLSGRAYVYQAMRISGSGDPRTNIKETLAGKLPQFKITKEAAAGFSSYGNQIGLATGFVNEYYHEGYIAKRMETGAVIGAVKKENVRREKPTTGDKIILLGGRTGRDGIGGATGSSKEHDISSLTLCGAEVQKGNAPEEHKIQRLFRKANVSKMIKKCNDFGAGGVGVAIGELADGLLIDLNKIPKKYSGLSGTDLAISESQERMAVVVEAKDVDKFISECSEENLEATVVADVTGSNRLQMVHDGVKIVDIARDFLDSAGAERFQNATLQSPSNEGYFNQNIKFASLKEACDKILSSLSVCSQKGLVEMFDSTIGAGNVLMPFGGKFADTPTEYMAAKIPVQEGHTSTISIMASGFDPYISSWSVFHGGLYAVIESVSKSVAAGANLKDIRLSFQEYFERLGTDTHKWGKPLAALLGTIVAQKELGLAAIGGKDSMSGTFKDKSSGAEINVPPTLISFAAAPSDVSKVITQELKEAGSNIFFIKTDIDDKGLIDFKKYKENISTVSSLIENNKIKSIYTIKSGGIIEAISKSAFGKMIGVTFSSNLSLEEVSYPYYGSFIVETDEKSIKNALKIGETIEKASIIYKNEELSLETLKNIWSSPLENVFPSKATSSKEIIKIQDCNIRPELKSSSYKIKPNVAILALPGTNCEYDTKRAFEEAGSREVEPFIFRNMSAKDAEDSCIKFAKLIDNSQIIVIPGGFSAGDEPEGSGKFYVSVLKNKYVKTAIKNLLEKRDGLILGICNGFQALIKTGLLTYGGIRELGKDDATLTFNPIGRHVSQIIHTRVASVKSPWMSLMNVGDTHAIPVSHGEGKFVASKESIDKMFKNGQVIFQYVDMEGRPTMESPYNPNGSDYAIEGICSPDGRVLGKMGHSERVGYGVNKNNTYADMKQNYFRSGVIYFTGEEK